jgi:hypothetical protein
MPQFISGVLSAPSPSFLVFPEEHRSTPGCHELLKIPNDFIDRDFFRLGHFVTAQGTKD